MTAELSISRATHLPDCHRSILVDPEQSGFRQLALDRRLLGKYPVALVNSSDLQ
jgi:hypothetical protein